MRKVTKQSVIGEKGIALVALRVSEMGHLWHPTSGVDSGIDGEIELRDSGTGEVRNFRIGVQSKATEGRWRSESDYGFLWRAGPEHIDYWLSSNQPVLLVCSRPKTSEAYWRDVREWARDPERRASGLVDFEKRRDSLDASTGAQFFSLGGRDDPLLAPPGPEPHPERLKTNLMPVLWDVEAVWSVVSPSPDSKALFQKALAAGVPRSDVAAREGRLWSLSPLGSEYLAAIEATGTPVEEPLASFAASDQRDRQVLLAELVRRSLLAHHWRQLRWYMPDRLAYFRLYDEGKQRRLRWAGGSGRTVVLPRASTKHEGLSGYRHEAARLTVRWLDGSWFVAVSPTYLFTYDGRKVSSFHADALKKMKTFDHAAAVSQQLRMWEWLLTRPASVLDVDEAPAPLRLGPLVEVLIAVRPPEAAWKSPPVDLRELDDDVDGDDTLDRQGLLFADSDEGP